MRIALVLIATVGCKQAGDAVKDKFDESKKQIAAIQVQRFANEAYPQWSATTRSNTCPDSLQQLLSYTDDRDDKDPWGAPLHMMCGANLPAGAKGIAIWSVGPDGKDGTPDDVRSWK